MIRLIDLRKHYDIAKTLSDSDRCTVFKATAKPNGETVVIRVMYGCKPDFFRFLSKINSPYTSQILDVMQDGGDTIIVEKFINGLTLEHTLINGIQLSEAQIYRIFYQLCAALSIIHRANIVHRDIKPPNIMLQDGTAILIDFDVARRHDPEQSSDTVCMGTKGYASPEQYGFAQTDNRSDIYSLGVVVKELLGERFNAVEFGYIIHKCIQFDPINRYQSADEILADLENCRTFYKKPPAPPLARATRKTAKQRRNATLSVLKTIGRVVGYVYFVVFCAAIILTGNDLPPAERLMSAASTALMTLFIFAPFFNWFWIRRWFPLWNYEKFYFKIIGFIFYAILAVLLLSLANIVMQRFYEIAVKEQKLFLEIMLTV